MTRPSCTFCSSVRQGSRASRWKTYPRFSSRRERARAQVLCQAGEVDRGPIHALPDPAVLARARTRDRDTLLVLLVVEVALVVRDDDEDGDGVVRRCPERLR